MRGMRLVLMRVVRMRSKHARGANVIHLAVGARWPRTLRVSGKLRLGRLAAPRRRLGRADGQVHHCTRHVRHIILVTFEEAYCLHASAPC
jgi:hypothetical protein